MSPRECAFSTTAATPAALARSAASVSTNAPLFLISLATVARDSALRATASTGYPRLASARVNAAPMPPAAPVTIAQVRLLIRAPPRRGSRLRRRVRSEEHTSELQSLRHLVCRLLLEKKKKTNNIHIDDKMVNHASS